MNDAALIPATIEHVPASEYLKRIEPRGARPEDRSWPVLDQDALYGIAGDFIRLVEPHSEADPMALLVQFLVVFGSMIGRYAFAVAEADRHHMNLFALLIGDTAKGRKGASWGQVSRLFSFVDDQWQRDCVTSGLSSGEGLIHLVRDPRESADGRVPDDLGVDDKRALIVEGEFATVLNNIQRNGNTLSATLRDAWDGRDLRTITKNSADRATAPHISVIAHCTQDEIRRRLDQTEQANGFANRFLWVCVRRSKCLPEGGSLDDVDVIALAIRIREAVRFGSKALRMERDAEARANWASIYEDLSAGSRGIFGAVTSRAEAQVLRLSCIYALLDSSAVVRPGHLQAAYAVWNYCEESARYVFGDAQGDVDEKILAIIRTAGKDGRTRTELRRELSNHVRESTLSSAIGRLELRGSIEVEQVKTAGRPSKVLRAR